tara:strand:- start:293 stop:832 length:540 start_codon:yes stop_codon:yes gene_type:complete
MKEYSNQPRKPQFEAALNIKQGKKKRKVSGSLYYEGEKTKKEIKPNKYVTVKEQSKTKALRGNLSFDLNPIRATLFGSTATTKGAFQEQVPFGTYEGTWKNIENDIGGALGYQINENNRVGIQVNKKFFQNQKGSANQIRLNWDVTNLGGGNLNVNLMGSDPFSGKKTKAMTLNYKVRF